MPISLLQIGKTKVTDFSVLARLPLEILLMLECQMDDLSFLEGLNLSHFCFTFKPTTKNVEVLKTMPLLTHIGTTAWDSFSPKEFWHRREKGLPMDEKQQHYEKE